MTLSLKHWKTQLHILWIGQAILMAVMTMSLPYWPLYISKLGSYSPAEIRFWSAAIYLAPFVSSMFSSPLWGKLGDRYGYKPMVIRACFGLFITQTLILIFNHVFWIFIFRLLQGILAGFIVAAQAWALALSPQEERSRTIGKLQSATAVGNLAGPLAGGIIATYAGYHAIFSLSSVICAMITILFFYFLEQTSTPSISDKKEETNFSLKKIFYFQNNIFFILLIIVMVQLARQVITPFFSLFVTEHLGGNDITVGVLYAATGLMIFLTAPKWGKLFDQWMKENRSIYFIVASLLFTSALIQILHACFNSSFAIFILRILWGISLGGLLPILLRLLVDEGKESEQGSFLGWGNSATKLGNLGGIIIGYAIESQFGYASSFIMTSFLYIFSGIIILTKIKPALVAQGHS